ncbi:MAG: hypothetical protein ACR2F2_00230, partial [Pyrinomonadaceae bacterium]
VHSAQVTYQSTTGGGDFANGLLTLQDAELVDSQVGGGEKSGFDFDTENVPFVRGTTPASFAVSANPTTATAGVTQTGTRSFCMATDGVLYQYKPAAAGNDAPVASYAVTANAMQCNTVGATVVE